MLSKYSIGKYEIKLISTSPLLEMEGYGLR